VLDDVIERNGAGYSAHHGGNFLMGNDPWFRPISILCGPDGGVFVSDWNDLGECHDSDGSYRSSGRIYKVTYGAAKPAQNLNLAKLSDAELVKLLAHKNDWFPRHAQRLLQERAVVGKLAKDTQAALLAMFEKNAEVPRKLRALWALHVTGGASEAWLTKQLEHPNEHVRWWAIRLLTEEKKASPALLTRFATMAKEDKSPFVRLGLASALQRLPVDSRWEIAEALLSHEEDSADKDLPLMIWYGIEPVVGADKGKAAQLLSKCKLPQVRQFIARRMAAN
jgi:hypothetical protein